MNPAREVKTERFSRTEGKTPTFVAGEVQKLLCVIETSTHTAFAIARSAWGPCLHFRPDRRRRESPKSVLETIFLQCHARGIKDFPVLPFLRPGFLRLVEADETKTAIGDTEISS
jgi:hypothetical protein